MKIFSITNLKNKNIKVAINFDKPFPENIESLETQTNDEYGKCTIEVNHHEENFYEVNENHMIFIYYTEGEKELKGQIHVKILHFLKTEVQTGYTKSIEYIGMDEGKKFKYTLIYENEKIYFSTVSSDLSESNIYLREGVAYLFNGRDMIRYEITSIYAMRIHPMLSHLEIITIGEKFGTYVLSSGGYFVRLNNILDFNHSQDKITIVAREEGLDRCLFHVGKVKVWNISTIERALNLDELFFQGRNDEISIYYHKEKKQFLVFDDTFSLISFFYYPQFFYFSDRTNAMGYYYSGRIDFIKDHKYDNFTNKNLDECIYENQTILKKDEEKSELVNKLTWENILELQSYEIIKSNIDNREFRYLFNEYIDLNGNLLSRIIRSVTAIKRGSYSYDEVLDLNTYINGEIKICYTIKIDFIYGGKIKYNTVVEVVTYEYDNWVENYRETSKSSITLGDAIVHPLLGFYRALRSNESNSYEMNADLIWRNFNANILPFQKEGKIGIISGGEVVFENIFEIICPLFSASDDGYKFSYYKNNMEILRSRSLSIDHFIFGKKEAENYKYGVANIHGGIVLDCMFQKILFNGNDMIFADDRIIQIHNFEVKCLFKGNISLINMIWYGIAFEDRDSRRKYFILHTGEIVELPQIVSETTSGLENGSNPNHNESITIKKIERAKGRTIIYWNGEEVGELYEPIVQSYYNYNYREESQSDLDDWYRDAFDNDSSFLSNID